MNRFAYEMLGRATWAVGKRKARGYFKRGKSHNPARIVGVAGILVIGAIVAGEVSARRA